MGPREFASKVGGGEISPSRFDATSSCAWDYATHPLQPQPLTVLTPPPQPCSDRADFPAHDVQPREFAAKVKGGEISPSRFEASSSYKLDFPAHDVQPREFAAKVKGGEIAPSRFEATTEAQNEFAHPITKCV